MADRLLHKGFAIDGFSGYCPPTVRLDRAVRVAGLYGVKFVFIHASFTYHAAGLRKQSSGFGDWWYHHGILGRAYHLRQPWGVYIYGLASVMEIPLYFTYSVCPAWNNAPLTD